MCAVPVTQYTNLQETAFGQPSVDGVHNLPLTG